MNSKNIASTSAAFLAAALISSTAQSQELPTWETFEWDGGGAHYDPFNNHYCAQIPIPPALWLPDCSIRETESGTFLLYNQLHKDFDPDVPDTRPTMILDTDYTAFRA